MPHPLRLTQDLEARLERLAHLTGLARAELIERCLCAGLSDLEGRLLEQSARQVRLEHDIDQRLRESGLGA